MSPPPKLAVAGAEAHNGSYGAATCASRGLSADPNADGENILACTNSTGMVYLNDTHGSFTAVMLDRGLDECMNVIAAELDGAVADNGVLDILFAGYAARPRLLEDLP